jgi:RHS repeat-associated protein
MERAMMQAAWMRGLGLLLAAVCAAPPARAQVVEYYHLDALGSVRAVSNQAGVVVENHDYLPYGEEWCGSGVCTGVSAGQPRRFTGKERDAETGLDYFGARYYGAKLGRFTTIDPVYTWQENLVDPQRWNRYAYVRGNPLRYVDPDGRAPAVAGVAAVVVELGLTAYDVYDAYSTVTDPEASTTAKVVSTAGLRGQEGRIVWGQARGRRRSLPGRHGHRHQTRKRPPQGGFGCRKVVRDGHRANQTGTGRKTARSPRGRKTPAERWPPANTHADQRAWRADAHQAQCEAQRQFRRWHRRSVSDREQENTADRRQGTCRRRHQRRR